jgi:chromosome segregation ATPase
MKNETASSILSRKAGFLATLAETAKELGEEIESLAMAVEAVEDARVELADALTDEDNTPADHEALRKELARKEERLAHKRGRVDRIEARLRNFKDDVEGCLGVDVASHTNL